MHAPLFAANTYARVGLETGVVGADPQRLVIMLYEGAISAIGRAQEALRSNDLQAKGAAIGMALRIIEEGLRASLDRSAGQSIARQLDELYQYMTRRLLLANLRNDAAPLAETERLLRELLEAWRAISPGASTAGRKQG